MALLSIQNVDFIYSGSQELALQDVSLSIEAGEFVVIIGRSGSGKSTLLKQIKPSVTPFGVRTGDILLDEIKIDEMSQREEVERIGYVSQSPDNQIVTDKVWHEMAFTLENLGYPVDEIRRRVVEMASYFDMTHWFYKDTHYLSGGEKQKLCVAAVMLAEPDILLLDEPAGQLDPIARDSFLDLLKKLHEDYGLTVILTEHRLDRLMNFATRMVLLEDGKLLFQGKPSEMVAYLSMSSLGMDFLPVKTAIGVNLFKKYDVFTVNNAKKLVDSLHLPLGCIPREQIEKKSTAIIIIKHVYFKYEKTGKEIVRDLTMTVRQGEAIAVIGSNGSGKSTLMKMLMGIYKPYRGKIKKTDLKYAMLFQEVENVFVKNTLKEDLEIMASSYMEIAEKFKICHLLDKHPYDLSGGEKQMAALAKVMLSEPDVLILDEPSHGMDMYFQKRVKNILKEYIAQGKTLIVISHDMEFCADITERALLLFDGQIVSEDNTKAFLSKNIFYTTETSKIAGHVINGVVLEEELIAYAESMENKKE